MILAKQLDLGSSGSSTPRNNLVKELEKYNRQSSDATSTGQDKTENKAATEKPQSTGEDEAEKTSQSPPPAPPVRPVPKERPNILSRRSKIRPQQRSSSSDSSSSTSSTSSAVTQQVSATTPPVVHTSSSALPGQKSSTAEKKFEMQFFSKLIAPISAEAAMTIPNPALSKLTGSHQCETTFSIDANTAVSSVSKSVTNKAKNENISAKSSEKDETQSPVTKPGQVDGKEAPRLVSNILQHTAPGYVFYKHVKDGDRNLFYNVQSGSLTSEIGKLANVSNNDVFKKPVVSTKANISKPVVVKEAEQPAVLYNFLKKKSKTKTQLSSNPVVKLTRLPTSTLTSYSIPVTDSKFEIKNVNKVDRIVSRQDQPLTSINTVTASKMVSILPEDSPKAYNSIPSSDFSVVLGKRENIRKSAENVMPSPKCVFVKPKNDQGVSTVKLLPALYPKLLQVADTNATFSVAVNPTTIAALKDSLANKGPKFEIISEQEEHERNQCKKEIQLVMGGKDSVGVQTHPVDPVVWSALKSNLQKKVVSVEDSGTPGPFVVKVINKSKPLQVPQIRLMGTSGKPDIVAEIVNESKDDTKADVCTQFEQDH